MYTLKRYFVLILCLCMSSYSIPVFAYTADKDDEVTKVELSDEAMAGIEGAGNIDATMLDYKLGGTPAQAIVVNRSGGNATYLMEVIDTNNVVLEVLATGPLLVGELKMITATPSLPGTQNRNIRIKVQAYGGHVSVDTSFAINSIDSDMDGITFWNEKKHGLNPGDPADATLDNDGDGLNNIDEINVHRTDPNNADTDGDGLDDGIEVQYKLNPLNAADATLDPDNDYLTNIEEILVRKTNPYVANPGLAPDTDLDGIKDAVELALGTDPNDPLSNDIGLNTAPDKRVIHFLNRTTFGPTPELVNEVRSKGESAWLAEQFTAAKFDMLTDGTKELRENSYTRSNLIGRVGAIRPVHATNQLQTRMSLFWDNHFSTSVAETRWDSELHEEDLFFDNAFGNFRTLLGISAKSDAMLRYLDLINSNAAGANENYSREVMELHTLGTTVTDGDYNGIDIAELARIFTGWSSFNDTTVVSRYKTYINATEGLRDSRYYKFRFIPTRHDATAKTFLGQVFPAGGGVDEGDRALDILAAHSSTAKFICLKLIRHFIKDYPNDGLVNGCANTFTATKDAPDQIAQVLQYLLATKDFNYALFYRNKFKDHQEYIFSLARIANWSAVGTVPATGIIPNGVLGDIYRAMGQRQYAKAEPTGWAEDVAGGWVSADSALHRFREGNKMSFNGQTKLAAEFKAMGITSSRDVLANLFLMMLGGNYDQKHMDMGYWLLHPNNATFDLSTMSVYTADARIRTLIARLAQLPEFNAH